MFRPAVVFAVIDTADAAADANASAVAALTFVAPSSTLSNCWSNPPRLSKTCTNADALIGGRN
jgi:hypothetical protein